MIAAKWLPFSDLLLFLLSGYLVIGVVQLKGLYSATLRTDLDERCLQMANHYFRQGDWDSAYRLLQDAATQDRVLDLLYEMEML